MMILPHATIVALVDGVKLELYRNSGNETAPQLDRIDAPNLAEHNKSSGAHHYSTSGNPDVHLLEEDAHAAAVTAWLNQQVLEHKIAHLVIVAPPRTLGEMRRHYHKQLRTALVSDLSKDLVGRSAQDILAALRSETAK